MGNCNSWGIFWQTLPLSIPAVVAAIAAIRNGAKSDKIGASVNGHMTTLLAKKDAYEKVIDDLSTKLAETEPTVVVRAGADEMEGE